MASETKKTKADPAPKKEPAAKDKSASSEGASKGEGTSKVEGASKVEGVSKVEGGETSTAAPANYSRGEGQKPVTKAYKENWNAIFAKKNSKKKKR